MRYSKIINYFLLALGLIVLVLFVRSLDFHSVIDGLKSAGFKVVFIVFLLMLLDVWLKALRWKVLVKTITGKTIGLWFSFLSIFAGVSSASLFPGRNEITKPLMLRKTYGASLSKTIPTALIEKVLDFMGLLFGFFLALIFVQSSDYNQYIIPFLSLAALLVLFLFVFPRKLCKLVSIIIKKLPLSVKLRKKATHVNIQAFECFDVLRKKQTSLIFFILSILPVFVEILKIYYIFLAFGLPISFLAATIGYVGSLLIGVITMIPGGVGVTEFSAAAIIKTLYDSYDLNKIKSIIFVDRIISYYFILVAGGFILLFYEKMLKKTKKVEFK